MRTFDPNEQKKKNKVHFKTLAEVTVGLTSLNDLSLSPQVLRMIWTRTCLFVETYYSLFHKLSQSVNSTGLPYCGSCAAPEAAWTLRRPQLTRYQPGTQPSACPLQRPWAPREVSLPDCHCPGIPASVAPLAPPRLGTVESHSPLAPVIASCAVTAPPPVNKVRAVFGNCFPKVEQNICSLKLKLFKVSFFLSAR